MPKRAWCSECGGYVMLTAEEICPNGHPRSALRAIEEVASQSGGLPYRPGSRAFEFAIPSVVVRRRAASGGVQRAGGSRLGNGFGRLVDLRFPA
jgi:hypothetical protein